MSGTKTWFAIWEPLSLVLLFLLMMGLGSTLSLQTLSEKIRKPKGILIGMFSQFLFMPFFCWILTQVFSLADHYSVALIVIGCCPGGAMSNLLCYIFQTDVTLSVAMTSASSVVALFMLFVNCFLYVCPSVTLSLSSVMLLCVLLLCQVQVISDIRIGFDWIGMVTGVIIVVLATAVGVKVISERYPEYSLITERIANWSMGIIVIGSMVSNRLSGAGLFGYPAKIYICAMCPSLMGTVVGLGLGRFLQLEKPSCIAVALETAVQNQFLALSIIALTLKDKDLRGKAFGVPIIYGFFSTLWGFTLCYSAFKLGWTAAPAELSVIEAFRAYRQKRSDEIKAIRERKRQQSGLHSATKTGSPRAQSLSHPVAQESSSQLGTPPELG